MVNPRGVSLLDQMEEFAAGEIEAAAAAAAAASEIDNDTNDDGASSVDEILSMQSSYDGRLYEDESLIPYDDDEDVYGNYEIASDNELETMSGVIEEGDEEDDEDESEQHESLGPLQQAPYSPVVDMGYEDQFGGSGNSFNEGGGNTDIGTGNLREHLGRKRSSVHLRRVSTESGDTAQSAPLPSPRREANELDGPSRRRVTIHGKSPDSGVSGDMDVRQQLPHALVSPIKRPRFKALDGARNSFVWPDSESDNTAATTKKTARLSFANRRKSRNSSPRLNSHTNMADAVERLRDSQSNDFVHVAAAVAVVASQTTRTFVQFGQGDHVLVMLTMLDLADKDGDKDAYTVDPVNAFGYPLGEGRLDGHKHGPYLYVLCVVTQVHFDEDERYYTVRRYDTDTQQRADPGYMEPIRDMDAIDAAMKASKRTESTMANQDKPVARQSDFCSLCIAACVESAVTVLRVIILAYMKSRNAAKTFIQHFIRGEHGYALNLHFTGVNFLVACSLIFLFHDVIALAFLSSDWDRSVGFLGLYVTLIPMSFFRSAIF